jgi:hypothetical protein
MSDPLQDLLAGVPVAATAFPPNSRYNGILTLKMTARDGTSVVYVRRRFIAQPDRFAVLGVHVVSAGERLDNVSARYLGDPELFWRLCDANVVIDPGELTDRVGREIAITLPEGIPGGRR